MRGILAWAILILVFLIAGYGLNLFRIHIVNWLAYGKLDDVLFCALGLVLAFLATIFLAGFVYYRDKKRGKLKREGWLGRPVKKTTRKGAASTTTTHFSE